MEEIIKSKLDVEDKRNHFLNADEQVFSLHSVDFAN